MKGLLDELGAGPAAGDEPLLAALGGQRCDAGGGLQRLGTLVARPIITECGDQASLRFLGGAGE